MSQPLLHIKNLSIHFVTDGARTQALKNINISVSRGELLAIVGESGSGKSVTSLSILQLLPTPPAEYVSGEILLNTDENTIDLLQLPREQLSTIRGNRVAMIFQEPMTSLNPVLTCGFQVREAILQHKAITAEEATHQTIALFEKVQLPDPAGMFHRYPHQLSGGQKQRVMIAMAMSCEPDLLICDEPTTALDVTVQKNILQLIRELQLQNKMSVIFITHDLGVVADIADRVAVMYKGMIVEQDTADTIFKEPKHPYTKALLACRPMLYAKGERLPVVSDFMEVDATGNIQEKSGLTVPQPQTPNPKPPTPNSRLLSVQNLKVWFPAKKTFLGKTTAYTKAVNDVSFDLYEGETLGLVGESGCGKSTLGRALLRLIDTKGGSIQYKNTDLLTASSSQLKALRKDMQIIFQDPYSSLNPRITIGEAIAEPLLVHGLLTNGRQRKEKVLELLEKVNLRPEHYYRYPHEFSGGQRQRIVIARALALQPSFIICDESVSALDVSVQAQVLNLLNDLKKEFGFTAIFISHDLSVVRYISDRILVMNKGRIEEMGMAEQVYTSPQSTYTQRLISSIPGIGR
ncbi:MAG: ABC transporter ATP-binding protein [Chitinophagaceae bacterium]|nr:ABC transporter ATP-binding protein [Chitinophagaceae bacterium]MCA6453135.1 ABC transporter ATP-binding protein [Chitinophagaceae bacterium]MCA6457831.1 ABC transporter ATP-binding protein [Chitinophagaceae bacterium]MCA6463544.1 ABC transporter ATP-binding protein [Chitinophagaceae bacterium]